MPSSCDTGSFAYECPLTEFAFKRSDIDTELTLSFSFYTLQYGLSTGRLALKVGGVPSSRDSINEGTGVRRRNMVSKGAI